MNISLDYTTKNTRKTSDEFNRSETYFYLNADPSDIRNQLTQTRTLKDEHLISVVWGFLVLDSETLYMGTEYEFKKNVDEQLAFYFNEGTQTYQDLNDVLSM